MKLMGALIALRLTKQISTALEIQMNDATFWLDSMNVLHWIHGRRQHNCRQEKETRMRGQLTANELRQTKENIIKESQHKCYPEEIDSLTRNKNLPKRV